MIEIYLPHHGCVPRSLEFLDANDLGLLKDPPAGGLAADVLRKGKIAFADNCARCHSSKKPDNLPADAEAQKKAWREFVLRDDFLKDNFLSDDERYPCSELGTHIARAAGT